MEDFLPAKKIFLPTLPHWTKSPRDSLELTALVMLGGMRGCDTWDRRREGTCRPHTIMDVKPGGAYALPVREASRDNPHIAQTVSQRCSCTSSPASGPARHAARRTIETATPRSMYTGKGHLPLEETVSDSLREQRLVIPEFSPLRAGSMSTPHQHHHRPGLYGVGERSEHRRLRFFDDVLGVSRKVSTTRRHSCGWPSCTVKVKGSQ